MPERVFRKEVPCPQPCGTNEVCRFAVKVSWDEVEDGGWIYASNLVFEMLPEQGSAGCRADFGFGSGQFEFTPRGGAAVTVNATNVWDQQLHARDPNRGSATGPGGSDVEYRDNQNNPVPDKSSGEPYKISYTAGQLDSFHIHIQHPCYCGCNRDLPAGTPPPNQDSLAVDVDFTKRQQPAGNNPPGGSGKCFVATAVYGEFSPEVALLREFRDRRLVPHPLGRRLVAAYYRTSPPIADILAGSPGLRRLARWALDRVVAGIRGGT